MALSYFNWSENNHNAGVPLFRPQSPLPEMLSFHEESTFYDTGSINPIFHQNYNFPYSPEIFVPAGNIFTPSPEFQDSTLTHQYLSLTHQDPCYNIPYLNIINQEQYFPVEVMPEIGYNGGDHGGCVAMPQWCSEVEVKRESEGSLSAQSMAARVRRRRISEKTQELGKLVPGGHKMNTAEMFKAAFKYIKFLQAQIGVLELMHSLPENEEVLSNGEMQALVACKLIQEKLYTAEKCIGPNTWQKPSE